MNGYPRRLEGGELTELFPGVFRTPYPNDERFFDGTRLSYEHFYEVARDIDVNLMSASRAFNMVYSDLREAAAKQRIIHSPQNYSYEHKPPAWEYLGAYGAISQHRRKFILLGSQAVHDGYQRYRLEPRATREPLQHVAVLETLLGFDQAREADEVFATPVEEIDTP